MKPCYHCFVIQHHLSFTLLQVLTSLFGDVQQARSVSRQSALGPLLPPCWVLEQLLGQVTWAGGLQQLLDVFVRFCQRTETEWVVAKETNRRRRFQVCRRRYFESKNNLVSNSRENNSYLKHHFSIETNLNWIIANISVWQLLTAVSHSYTMLLMQQLWMEKPMGFLPNYDIYITEQNKSCGNYWTSGLPWSTQP